MISQVILLSGDPFLAEEKRKSLIAAVREQAGGEVAVSVYSASDADLEQVLAEARTLPFAAKAQVQVLRDAEQLREKQIKILEAFMEHPSAGSFLILESSADEKLKPLAKAVQTGGECIVLEDSDKKNSSMRFIQDKLRRAGKTMTGGAVARLEDQCGTAPVFLDSMLEQLITYSGTEKVITEEMVEAFEENWKEIDVFSLINAISGRKTGQALVILRQLVENQDREVIGLIGLLHWQIRRLWQARALLDQGMPESAVMKKCRIYPKQAGFFMRQLRAFSLKQLEDSLEGLFQVDWDMKSGRRDGPPALEQWVIETA